MPEQKKAKELELARELYDKHTHLIERTLYALLGQPHSVAHSKSMEYEDLLQYARMGLWEACISYDSSKSQFETYAINHIRWSVQMGLERDSSLFKYNPNDKPDPEDIFDITSFDSPVASSSVGESLTYSETISDTTLPSMEETLVSTGIINKALSSLSDIDRTIMELKALDRTDREIADLLGRKEQSINRTVRNLQGQLREKLKGKL